jgi:hypothetical protein
MPDNQERDYDVSREVLEVLLKKIEGDTYPSTTMMDMAEELLQPESVQRYAQILLAKATSDTYPSLDLLNRVRGLSGLA